MFFSNHKFYDGNPFFIKKGKVACMLVHGLTSSTQEMEDLGLSLSKNNLTVLAILLKGHNASIADLNKTTYSDWLKSIREGYNFLKKNNHKKIYLISSSTGATLSLYFSICNKLSGVVALAPAIFFNDKKVYLTPYIKFFKKLHKKDYSKYFPGRNEALWDIVDEKASYERRAYKYVPLNSLNNLLKLIKIVRNSLHRIKVPLLLIHSKNDHTIVPYSSEYIYENVESDNKKIVWLEKSGHVLTVDIEKKTVFEEIKNWISKLEQDK